MENIKIQKNKGNAWQLGIAILVVIPAILFWCTFILAMASIANIFSSTDDCNIARIPIQGILATTDNGLSAILGLGIIASSDGILEEIEQALDDDSIAAILIDVDSPGGTPVAADEILNAITRAAKPTVAVVRDRGTSAAYWAIAGSDYIIASPVSDVGSIGVTMSYLEIASSTDMEGTRWIDLSSGMFKDAGDPTRTLREEEQTYFKNQVDDVHNYMVSRIVSVRESLDAASIGEIDDGRAFLGTDALELGLVDELGSFAEAVTYFSSVLSISEKEIRVCPAAGGGLEELLY